MSRIKKSNNNTSIHMPLNISENEYGLSDLNWEDSAGTFNENKKVEDPSMNDYLKGYQMEPYEFKQYAGRNILHQVKRGETLFSIAKKYYGHERFAGKIVEMNDSLIVDFRPGLMLIVGREPNNKYAAKEVIDISYTPENIAKEILTLWSQADGPLQDFFDAFTANKMTNEMKKQVADNLKEMGYDVTPVLVDETPKYAAPYKSFSKISSIINKKNKSVVEILNTLDKVLIDSKLISKVAEEVNDLKENENIDIDKDSFMGLLDYYKQIFPDDYAIALLDITFDKPNVEFDEFKDIQISDKALEQMEKMDSGTQNLINNNPNNGGVGGYDFTTQMRPDGPGGVSPNQYETRASRVKKKVVADELETIPLSMVMDALSIASKSVSYLLSLKLEVPPVPLKTVKKQTPKELSSLNDQIPQGFKIPAKKDEIFEIWKIFLEENPEEIDEAFVVLSADYMVEGYKGGKWENVEYRGFYTTLEEAQNEISGYLK